MDNGSLRNMDDIQESDDESRGVPRGVTAALVALGAACIGFAAMALGGHSSKDAVKKVDPLGDLVTQKGKSASGPGKAADLTTNEVTFPGILSDENNPTTALAAVKPNGSQSTAALPPPPAPSDKLPVVPVPAQNVLQATPVVTRPRDALTKTATRTSPTASRRIRSISMASSAPGATRRAIPRQHPRSRRLLRQLGEPGSREAYLPARRAATAPQDAAVAL